MDYKKRNRVIIWVVVCFIVGIAIFEIQNFDTRTTLIIPEEPVTIITAFMCSGPDEEGNPLDAWEKISRKEISKIYLCVEVIPDGHATLKSYWIYDSDGRSFVQGPAIRVVEEKFVYFSLEEAIENGIEGYYFEEEMESRNFPPGDYSVVLRQIRTDQLAVNFRLTE